MAITLTIISVHMYFPSIFRVVIEKIASLSQRQLSNPERMDLDLLYDGINPAGHISCREYVTVFSLVNIYRIQC